MENVPENGWIEMNAHGRHPYKRVELNDVIFSVTLVQYKCNENYHNFDVAENVCHNRQWRYKVPNCERFCVLGDAVTSHVNHAIKCSIQTKVIPCTDRIQIGTNLIIDDGSKQTMNTFCNSNSQWEASKIRFKLT